MVHCVTREEEGQLSSFHTRSTQNTHQLPGLYRLLLIKLFQVKTSGSSPNLSTGDLDPACSIKVETIEHNSATQTLITALTTATTQDENQFPPRLFRGIS